MAQRLDRRERGRALRGPQAEEEPDRRGEAEREQDRLRRDGEIPARRVTQHRRRGRAGS